MSHENNKKDQFYLSPEVSNLDDLLAEYDERSKTNIVRKWKVRNEKEWRDNR